MSFLQNTLGFFGIDTISLEIISDNAFESSQSSISGTLTITGLSDQVIDKIELSLIQYYIILDEFGRRRDTLVYTIALFEANEGLPKPLADQETWQIPFTLNLKYLDDPEGFTLMQHPEFAKLPAPDYSSLGEDAVYYDPSTRRSKSLPEFDIEANVSTTTQMVSKTKRKEIMRKGFVQ